MIFNIGIIYMVQWQDFKPNVSKKTIDKRNGQISVMENLMKKTVIEIVNDDILIKRLVSKLEKIYSTSTVHSYISCILGLWNNFSDRNGSMLCWLHKQLKEHTVTSSKIAPFKITPDFRERLMDVMKKGRGAIARLAQLVYFPETRGLRPQTYLYTKIDWNGNMKHDHKSFNILSVPKKTLTVYKRLKNFREVREIELSDDFITWLPKTGHKLELLIYKRNGMGYSDPTGASKLFKKHFGVSFSEIRKGVCQNDYDNNVPVEQIKKNCLRLGHSMQKHVDSYIRLPKPKTKTKGNDNDNNVPKEKIEKFPRLGHSIQNGVDNFWWHPKPKTKIKVKITKKKKPIIIKKIKVSK